jgi:2-haloacid dehalogenase
VILFDLGGVLIDWNPRRLYRKTMGEAETEHFLANVCTSEWNLALDGGRPFSEGIREKQEAWPAYREAIAWWGSRWEEMLGGPIQGTVDILAELRDQGRRIYALTNWSAETFPRARARFEFLAWFGDTVVSGEEGMVKPDPAFYRLAARRCGAKPGDIVFIDDSRVNVEAAAGLGFQAIHFTGPEALRADLVQRNLLCEGLAPCAGSL